MEQISNSQKMVSPNPLLLIQSDFLAKMAAVFPLFFLVLTVVDALINLTREDTTTLLIYTGIALVIGAPIILWRYSFIKRKLIEGVEVDANVVNKVFSRRNVELKFTYAREGKSLTKTILLSNSGKINKLKPGDHLTLVFDKENPEKYLIRELYV